MTALAKLALNALRKPGENNGSPSLQIMDMQAAYVIALKRIAGSYMIAFGIWGVVCLLFIPEHQAVLGVHAINSYYLQAMAIRFFAIAALTPPAFYLGKKVSFTPVAAWRAISLYVVGCALFDWLYVILVWLAALLCNLITHAPAERSSTSLLLIPHPGFADMAIFYVAIIIAANFLAYFEASKYAAIERAELRRSLASSELEALEAKLHPHFVFNVLHGIATLIDVDATRAKFMLIQLSSLLRMSLRHNSSDLVPLRDELNFTETYLELEKMRLGTRLVVNWEIEDETRRCLVPHLVLQQLVENAIVHGIACSRKAGSVTVTTIRSEQNLLLTVNNSLGEEQSSGTGIGLASIRSRLKHLYGEDARLQLIIDYAAKATVSVPFLYGDLHDVQYSEECDSCCAS